jgi:hypothetical protein
LNSLELRGFRFLAVAIRHLCMETLSLFLEAQTDCRNSSVTGFYSLCSSGCFDDLWVFDTISHKWTQIEVHNLNDRKITMQNELKPPKRHGHSLTLVDEAAYLFGGYGTGGRLNDTWKLDPGIAVLILTSNPVVLLSWSLIDISGNRPVRRSHHTAIGLRNKLILFGGLGPSACQDLWELNVCKLWRQYETHFCGSHYEVE